MTIKKLKEILECNEPVFHYNGKQYGICFVGGKFIAGEVGEEDSDESFYTVEELFCCAYAPYFWQAIQIRYREYATYNRKLYALFGGAD